MSLSLSLVYVHTYMCVWNLHAYMQFTCANAYEILHACVYGIFVLLSHFNTHSAESKTCQFLSLRQMDQHERWIYNKSKDIADMEKGIAHPHALVCNNIED